MSDKMDRARCTTGGNPTSKVLKNLNWREHLIELAVNGMRIWNCVLEITGWAAVYRIHLAQDRDQQWGSCEHDDEPFGFHKRKGISPSPELLSVPQNELCSMEFCFQFSLYHPGQLNQQSDRLRLRLSTRRFIHGTHTPAQPRSSE
jgi:hypothetical protein